MFFDVVFISLVFWIFLVIGCLFWDDVNLGFWGILVLFLVCLLWLFFKVCVMEWGDIGFLVWLWDWNLWILDLFLE